MIRVVFGPEGRNFFFFFCNVKRAVTLQMNPTTGGFDLFGLVQTKRPLCYTSPETCRGGQKQQKAAVVQDEIMTSVVRDTAAHHSPVPSVRSMKTIPQCETS